MKMLMIIVDDRFNDVVEEVLDDHQVKGFTEIPMVYGEGGSGKKLGSRLHPGASSLVFTVVPDDQVDSLVAALKNACSPDRECGPEVHIAVLGVEKFI
jgi:uncharacterized protein YaaQ